jgi:hypothetical protein
VNAVALTLHARRAWGCRAVVSRRKQLHSLPYLCRKCARTGDEAEEHRRHDISSGTCLAAGGGGDSWRLMGLERERLGLAAGMRTHALVSLGSAVFMVVAIFGFFDILAVRHVILGSFPRGRVGGERHRLHRGGHDHSP